MNANQGARYDRIIESVFQVVYGRMPARGGEQEEADDEALCAMSDFFVMELNLDVEVMAADWKNERAARLNEKAMGDDDEISP